MSNLPDLVRDSRLETKLHAKYTIHRFHELDSINGARTVIRQEYWQRQRYIRSGSYGRVWLERCVKGGKGHVVRAVKEIAKPPARTHMNYNRELEAIAKFSHDRYVRCFVKSFGWYEHYDTIYIAMEYFPLGDLNDHLATSTQLPENEAKEIVFQLLEGLQFLHENGFAHRDLKPSNIFIKAKPPENWWVKIGDFGISKRAEDGAQASSSLKGTLEFMAPELHGFVDQAECFDKDAAAGARAADMWSLGEITFQLMTKEASFKNLGILSAFVRKPELFPVDVLQKRNISLDGIDLVRSLMQPGPQQRISADRAIIHAWVAPYRTPSPRPLSLVSLESLDVDGEVFPAHAEIHAEPSGRWSTISIDKVAASSVQDANTTRTTKQRTHGNSAPERGHMIESSINRNVGHMSQKMNDLESAPTAYHSAADGTKKPTDNAEEDTNFLTGAQQSAQLNPFVSRNHTPLTEVETPQYFHDQRDLPMVAGQDIGYMRGREKVLCSYDVDTLDSKYWLAQTLYEQQKYSEAEGLFRGTAQGREKVLGKEHIHTLDSKYSLAQALYEQQKYSEAEGIFRETAQRQEKVLGKEHADTLDSKYWLAQTLYEQQKHSEAEGLFRGTAQGQEKVFGKEHTDTLNSKSWLARTLYEQQKYSEAEGIFRGTAQGREKVLGKEHADTLDSNHWLAYMLYKQQKYSEAEGLFWETAQGCEKMFGKEHAETLYSKYWLAQTLYEQQKYSEAEGIFRGTAQGREKVLGKEHVDTLDSKYSLAQALYEQQKYSEAEGIFRETAQRQEKVLGKDHADTVDSKYQLARTLFEQQKYREAEGLFRETAQVDEKVFGKEHDKTLDSKHWLARTLHKQ